MLRTLALAFPVLAIVAAPATAQMKWTKFGGTTPGPRRHATLGYDAGRLQMVLFGGRDQLGAISETWIWDSVKWTMSTARPMPAPREYSAMAYDPKRRRLVMFGGRVSLAALDDTWEWDGKVWQQMKPSTKPSSRSEHALAYDQKSGRIVLFGGVGNRFGLLGDTWTWDGKDWKLLNVAGPKGRRRHGLAPDSLGRLVLCGGLTTDWPGINHSPTWTWDSTKWTRQKLSLEVPAMLTRGAAFDPLRNRTVLLAPAANGQPVTWEWDGIAWTRRIVTGGPPDGPTNTLAYAQVAGAITVVTIGDAANKAATETWTYRSSHLARMSAYGASCRGSSGSPSLRGGSGPEANPWIGGQLQMFGDTLPASAPAALLMGASNSKWGTRSLPFSLAPIGAPGCALRASPDVSLPLVADNRGSTSFRTQIPNNPWLLGRQLHHQLAIADRPTNALGVITTNGLTAIFGGR